MYTTIKGNGRVTQRLGKRSHGIYPSWGSRHFWLPQKWTPNHLLNVHPKSENVTLFRGRQSWRSGTPVFLPSVDRTEGRSRSPHPYECTRYIRNLVPPSILEDTRFEGSPKNETSRKGPSMYLNRRKWMSGIVDDPNLLFLPNFNPPPSSIFYSRKVLG